MSQADVLAVFGPGEQLTRAEIGRRMVERGVKYSTALRNIVQARATKKLKKVGEVPNSVGKQGSVWLYAVVD